MNRIDGCTALITGASAGIGREFARQLASRAVAIVLVARRRARLEELQNELAKINSNLRVYVRDIDLSDERAMIQMVDSLGAENLTVDFLINNAGLGDYGAFATSNPERVRQMIAVKYPTIIAYLGGVIYCKMK